MGKNRFFPERKARNHSRFSQRSLSEPILCNIFINDLLHFIKETDVFNFGDDTTLYKCGSDLDIRGRNKVSLFDRSFLVLTQSHCSSPITANGFGREVSPLFFPAFAGSFPHFSYKGVSD